MRRFCGASVSPSQEAELPLPRGAAQGAPRWHRSVLLTQRALRKGLPCPRQPDQDRPSPQALVPACDGHSSQVTLAGLSSALGRGQPSPAAGPAFGRHRPCCSPTAQRPEEVPPKNCCRSGHPWTGGAEGLGTASAITIALCWDLPPPAARAFPAPKALPCYLFLAWSGSTHYRTLSQALAGVTVAV